MKMRKHKKMIIGIDASRSISGIKKTGVEIVSDHMILGLLEAFVKKFKIKDLKLKDEFDLIFYTPEKIKWLPESNQKIFGPKRFWTVYGLSLEMLKNKPDVLFVPVHTLPFFCPKKTIKIVHDIAFREYPKIYDFWTRVYLNFDLRRCVKICKKIIVPTSKVKMDLLSHTDVNENKIAVVRWGYDPKSAGKDKRATIDTESQIHGEKFGLNRKKQILYIGRIEEKKNILNLAIAFKIFSGQYPDYILLLAGKSGFGFKDLKFNIESKLKIKNLKFLGYVSELEKQKLLRESCCLVLISKDEGFGLPILEAFASGLPVIASDISALREVGGAGCVYVKPDSPEGIASGLKRIAEDMDLRKIMIERGYDRLKIFRSDKSAKQLIEILIS